MAQTLDELQNTLAFLQKENDTLKTLVKESQSRLSETQGLLATYEAFCDVDMFPEIESRVSIAKEIESLGGLDSVKESVSKLKAYEALGTVEDIVNDKATFDRVFKEHDAYVRLGSLDQVKESLEQFDASKEKLDLLARYEEFGSVEEMEKLRDLFTDASAKVEAFGEIGSTEEIKSTSELLSKYAAFGSVEEVEKAAEALKGYTDLGDLESMTKVAETFAKYVDLGTLEQVGEFKAASEAFESLGYDIDKANELLAKAAEDAREAELSRLTAFGITKEVAESTLAMNGGDIEKAATYLESLGMNKKDILIGKKIESVDTTKETKRNWLETTSEGYATSLHKFL